MTGDIWELNKNLLNAVLKWYLKYGDVLNVSIKEFWKLWNIYFNATQIPI